MYQRFILPALPSVSTRHFLDDGYAVPHHEYELYRDRFAWVNKAQIVARILALRERTDPGNRSIIAIYEKDQRIREFVNVEQSFSPLCFC